MDDCENNRKFREISNFHEILFTKGMCQVYKKCRQTAEMTSQKIPYFLFEDRPKKAVFTPTSRRSTRAELKNEHI